MKTLRLTSNKLPPEVYAPTSKSYAARALILASLSPRAVHLINLPQAQDTIDLKNALTQVGIKINDGLISNSFPTCEVKSSKSIKLNIGEGGTTARFLLPFLSLGSNCYELVFAPELKSRPMTALYESLSSNGVRVEQTATGVRIQGPLDINKIITIDAGLSSQFASGFELLKLSHSIHLDIQNLSHSQAYLEMSRQLTTKFAQSGQYEVPADFSSASYIMAYAIFNQDIVISNLGGRDPLQADDKIFDVLDQIGARYEFLASGLKVYKTHDFKQGFEVDARDCIDLVPTLMFIASYIPYKSILRNLNNLKYKESDRLTQMKKILTDFGVSFQYDEAQDIFTIHGSQECKQVDSLMTDNDHRMVMVASLFLKQNGGGEIGPINSVNKSFPNFFQLFT